MKKLHWKSFLVGVLAVVVVIALALPVLGAGGVWQTWDVLVGGYTLVVDGQTVQPEDANGNPVEIANYNGTTYLPIRAIGKALGKEVDYDSETRTIYLGAKSPLDDDPDKPSAEITPMPTPTPTIPRFQLIVASTALNMDVNTTQSLQITVYCDTANHPFCINYEIEKGGIVSAEWGDWYGEGNRIDLSITGLTAGTDSITISITDVNDSGIVYVSKTISVSVSDTPMTRAELAQFIVTAFGWDTPKYAKSYFTDVDTSLPEFGAIMLLAEKGIIEGYYDGTFSPNGGVTKAEAASILARALLGRDEADKLPIPEGDSLPPDVSVTHWAAKYIAFCVDKGIMLTVDGYFNPKDLLKLADIDQAALKAAINNH